MWQSLIEGDALGHVILQHPLDEIKKLLVLRASGAHVFLKVVDTMSSTLVHLNTFNLFSLDMYLLLSSNV